MVPLTPDDQWHTVRSLQVPNQSARLEVSTTTAWRAECDGTRIPERTQIRVVQLESFQDLKKLPERLEDAKPRDDGIPIGVADSGPYDLTLVGATRIVPLITGKQLLARTADRCAALFIFEQQPDRP